MSTNHLRSRIRTATARNMRVIPLFTIQIMLLILFSTASSEIRDTSRDFIARQKRFLIYQEGVNWVQMVVAVGFPVEIQHQSVTWGTTMYSYYLLPTNSSEVLYPSINIERKRRSPTRWQIYSAIRDFIDRFNLGNGKTCLMRAICEAALAPFDKKTGLLSEIMHIFLTPSATNEETQDYTDLEYHAAEKLGKDENDCARLFSQCNYYFLEQLSKIFK